MSPFWTRYKGYLLAIGLTVAIVGLRTWFLDGWLRRPGPFTFLMFAVLGAAWAGGLRAGLLATLLTTFSAILFFISRDGWLIARPIDGIRTVLYVVLALALCAFFELLHRARRRYKTAADDALANQERLREFAEQMQIVTDAMDAAVARCDRNYRYLWVSKPYGTLMRRPIEKIVGRTVDHVIGAETFNELIPYYEKVLKGERVEYERQVHYRDGGGSRWIHAIYTPTFDSSGRTDGWVAVVVDITERKLAVENLKEADRRKDEFLATLAHELRNPLAPISNAVQLWPMVVNDPEQMEDLRGVIARQVKHMTRIINDLLDVSRISRGRLQLKNEPVDLADVIKRAVETTTPLMEQHSHNLQVSLADDPLWVQGDPDRLMQVIGNVLNNAAKYTPAGGEVQLRAGQEEGQVMISIRDNGIGIPPGMNDEIFEMFRQVDLTTSRSHEGLGIGLTLVRQIIDRHGGTVEARSEGEGRGSEFVVRLPAIGEPLVTGTGKDSVDRTASMPRRSILVVDDAPESAETLAALLRHWGQDVSIASDGPSAIRAVMEKNPDLVLLDIAMPGMDGYAVARSLRSHPELASLTLVALTGYGREEDRRHAQEAGFDLHLTKPADTEKLAQLLRAPLRRGQPASAV